MSNLSLPQEKARELVELALSLIQLAQADIRASRILYRRAAYSQAVYFFQQSVEKNAKAVGLLTGTLKPNADELGHEVGHVSLLALLLHLPEQLDLNAIVAPIAKEGLAKAATHPDLQGTGLDQLVAKLSEGISVGPSKAPEAHKAIAQVRAMDKAKLWRMSLNLDPNEDFTKNIFRLLEEAKTKLKQADEAEAWLPLIPKLFEQLLKVRVRYRPNYNLPRFFLNIHGRASPLLVPLTLVSMGHERETRYPPIKKEDYWDPQSYTIEKGLVSHLPEFIDYTKFLCKASKRGAIAARNGFS